MVVEEIVIPVPFYERCDHDRNGPVAILAFQGEYVFQNGVDHVSIRRAQP